MSERAQGLSMHGTSDEADAQPFGIASSGSPLYAAIIGAEDLDRSIDFYTRHIGLDLEERRTMSGAAFERHWRLPAGAKAEMAVLSDRGFRIGRVALIRFEGEDRRPIRGPGQRYYGFINLNFYCEDIYGKTKAIVADGYPSWTDPVVHVMEPSMGQPIEVMIDGPDTVIINLIELAAPNPDARVLRTKRYIQQEFGYNRQGFTPVATSQHCVKDYEAAFAFGTQVLGQSVRNNTILEGESMEEFMLYPKGARARDTYLQGDSLFGKTALNHPLNYENESLIERAVPPNIGYITQSYRVPDLDAALAAAGEVAAETYSPIVELDIPAIGSARTAIVRNPGSGGLTELIQA